MQTNLQNSRNKPFEWLFYIEESLSSVADVMTIEDIQWVSDTSTG